ncbi:hypothetical protein EVG20_g1529 [Dentipellis fragilis]|uniref:Uncharacterized protein n=1 Tax=Dentipellis fragilis TaxID=205917 RepID=A0A4Y9Z9C5_9AGAM|nr:hypothetical protein EVG20_g1529 [Dentipellis fragilis]
MRIDRKEPSYHIVCLIPSPSTLRRADNISVFGCLGDGANEPRSTGAQHAVVRFLPSFRHPPEGNDQHQPFTPRRYRFTSPSRLQREPTLGLSFHYRAEVNRTSSASAITLAIASPAA